MIFRSARSASARRASPPRSVARGRRRGAVLIVALLLAALIAVALGSYLNLNLSSTRLAQRTFNGYAALNLAEAGTEEAVWSFNRSAAGDSAAWNNWQSDGHAVWRKFTDFDFGATTSGSVKVYVASPVVAGNVQPKLVAQSSVGPNGSSPSTKMIEVTLRRRSFFANGVVAKNSVVFNGANASVDSWNSDPDSNTATPAVAYSSVVRTDHGSVASTAFVNTAVLLNQANVWGYVATGGSAPQVGNNGTVRGANTPANVAVDPSRVSTDFNASFAPVTVPDGGTPLASIGATLGTAHTATSWRAPGIVLSGNDTLTIYGDVTLVLTAPSGADAISVTGRASINIAVDSSLTVYAEGDVKIAGNGLANLNLQPISCQIWGTNHSVAGQKIDLKGNGALKAVVYAPEGDVTLNGNGDMMGSVVGRNVTFSGNAAFHYDESLANYGTGSPFKIAKWRELTTEADRAPYAGVFSGW
ncbi:MAG TPA: hypothetical protein VHD62_05955 [Opitutaceae bacterium]|nr:hypothetical protein [Opitutaceae bacterium]